MRQRLPISDAKNRMARSVRHAGFTVLELLIASTVMIIVLAMVLQMTAAVADVWKNTSSKISAFQGARAGFDAMARSLGQATLMSYHDYVDGGNPPQPRTSAAGFTPLGYARASELHFLSGPANTLVPGANTNNTQGHAVFFQAPLGVVKQPADFRGLNNLLNAVGFFLEYADDKSVWPDFIRNLMGSETRRRFRLMQWVQPSEEFAVYNSTKPTGSQYIYDRTWISNGLVDLGFSGISPPAGKSRPRAIGSNIVMMVIRPQISFIDEDQLVGPITDNRFGGKLAPRYLYDSRSWEVQSGSVTVDNSLRTTRLGGGPAGANDPLALVKLMRNQLPPLVEVAMVAITDADAQRLSTKHGDQIPPELRLPPNTFHTRSGPTAANAADYFDDDLQTYTTQLADNGISHRVLRATIQVTGAKWSKD